MKNPITTNATHWTNTTLGEITKIQTGKLDANAQSANGSYAFFTCGEEIRQIDHYAFDTEAVLLAGNGNFNVKWYKGKFNAYQRTYVIEPKGVDGKWLYYAVQYSLQDIVKGNRGSVIRFIRIGDIVNCPVQVPALDIQREIVEEIETQFSRLDAGVAALKRVQANLKRYRAAVLKAACEGRLVPTEAELARAQGRDYESAKVLLQRILTERREKWNGRGKYKEPAAPDIAKLPELPEGWGWANIDQLAEVGTGATPKRGTSAFYDGGNIPWITSAALNKPFVNEASEFVTDEALAKTNLTLYESGTLLVAMYGEGKTRGKCSELRIEATTNQAIAAVQCYISVREYVKLSLLRQYEDLRLTASGGVQPNLNLSLVKAITIPLPPLAEQERIVAEVERRLSVIDELQATVTANLQRATRLRQSILQKAFSGNLVSLDAP